MSDLHSEGEARLSGPTEIAAGLLQRPQRTRRGFLFGAGLEIGPCISPC